MVCRPSAWSTPAGSTGSRSSPSPSSPRRSGAWERASPRTGRGPRSPSRPRSWCSPRGRPSRRYW
jgi:hypothetical protein